MSKFSLGVWNHGPRLAERVCYVSPSFNYSSGLQQFNKIQDAINWIYNDSGWYSSLGNSEHAVIYVYPGRYVEQLDAKAHIQIVGIAGANVLRHQAVELFNTGQTESTYPIKTSTGDQLILDGFSVTTNSSGVFGPVQYAEFHNCAFRYGKFIETQRTEYQTMDFKDSMFFNVGSGEYHMDLTGARGITDNWITFNRCWIGSGRIRAHSTNAASSWGSIQIKDSSMKHSMIDIGGDWGFMCDGMHSYGNAYGRNKFSTSSDVSIHNSVPSNGLHFISAPSSLSINNTLFADGEGYPIPAGEGDIISDVVLTDVVYNQNSQCNGLNKEVQFVNPVKPTGAGAINRYRTIQEAIGSIATKGTVELSEDLTALAPLVIGTGKTVTIDGMGAFGLSFTANIANLIYGDKLILRNLKHLNGADIELNSTGAEVTIELCPSVIGHIKITNGSKVVICRSALTGSTGAPAITVNYGSTDIEIGYSTIKGSAANPAILFTADADNRLKAKFNTFIHGSGGGNAPLSRIGTFVILFSAYSCASNVRLDVPPGFTNVVTLNNNTVDTSITF